LDVDAPLRVLRLCSVFEPPASALGGRAARFDPVGGMQEHTGELTRALARRGLVQAVLTARPPTAPWLERPAPAITIVRVALPVRRPRRLYALPAAILAPLMGRDADVVHVHLGEDLAILPLAALAAHARRLPVIVTVHCSLAHTLKAIDARTAVLRHLGGRIERGMTRRAAATVVYTRLLAERMAADAGDRVQVMRRGVDRRPFAVPGDDPFPRLTRSRRVVYLGRIARCKGIATLIEALPHLRTPEVDAVLVGDGPERAHVERLAGRLGVADRVHVTGFVAHERVPAVLAAADVLVLPSVYEELGTVLIEAMQCGLPVVASRVGGIPEAVEDGVTGLLVEPGEPRALATAIDAVLGDRELAARLGANARLRAPDYGVDRVCAEVHALYLRVAEERARSSGGSGRRLPRRSRLSLWPA
jgi:glycogen(starch) synthase